MKWLSRRDPSAFLLSGRSRPGDSPEAREAFNRVLLAGSLIQGEAPPSPGYASLTEQLDEAVREARGFSNPALSTVLRQYELLLAARSVGLCGQRTVEEKRQTFIIACRQALGTDTAVRTATSASE